MDDFIVGGRIIKKIIRRKTIRLSIWKWKDLIIIAEHIALDLLNISVIMFDQPYITVLEILAKIRGNNAYKELSDDCGLMYLM